MSEPRAVHLDEDEREAFLGAGGTGVMSFANEAGPPHSIPVSYGYDADTGSFFFRLAYGADTEKPGPADVAVSFVVYGETDEGWHSVVAKGELESTDAEATSTTALEALRRVDIPLVDVFERPTVETDFEFFRLQADDVTGRKEAATAGE
jgi:nitroimidazol reductase NimA-like FMN-containing flavoprotein (pyridoxamine 5'-phosphate oxidase superfamily)